MNTRKALLATVSAAALGVTGAIGGFTLMHKAEAATNTVELDLTLLPAVPQVVTENEAQFKEANEQYGVDATLGALAIGDIENTVVTTGGGTIKSVIENDIFAEAFGNVATANFIADGPGGNTVFDLNILADDLDGVSLVNSQGMFGLPGTPIEMAANVATSQINLIEDTPAANTTYRSLDNTITASTIINNAVSWIDVNDITNKSFTSETPGSIDVSVDVGGMAGTASVETTGTFSLSSVQTNILVNANDAQIDIEDPEDPPNLLGTATGTSVTGSQVFMWLQDSAPSGTIRMDDNRIDATFIGNRALDGDGRSGNTILLREDAIGTFEGTLVLSSIQSNYFVDANVESTNNRVQTNVFSSFNGGLNVADGSIGSDAAIPVSLNDNAITATATGNLAGNLIDSAVTVASGAATTGTVDVDVTGTTQTAAMDSHVSLLNAQLNVGADGNPNLLTSFADGVRINIASGLLENDSSITAEGNLLLARSQGNQADSIVRLGGADESFVGTAAIGNVQVNQHLDATAAIGNPTVVGAAGGENRIQVFLSPDNTLDGDHQGRVTMADNRITAESGGSAASNLLLIDVGGFITGGGASPATATVSQVDAGDAATAGSVTADAVISSGQHSSGDSTYAASITESRISLIARGGEIGADFDGDLRLLDNSIEASAVVNRIHRNTIALGGEDTLNTISATGAVLNNQLVAVENAVTATIQAPDGGSRSADIFVDLGLDDDPNLPANFVGGGALTVEGNTIGTLAAGNIASGNSGGNEILVTTENAIATATGTAAAANVDAIESGDPFVSGGYVIGSQQHVELLSSAGSFSARTEDSRIRIFGADSAVDGTLKLVDNEIYANATVNRERSLIALGAGSTVQASAAIGNLQQIAGEAAEGVTAFVGLENRTSQSTGIGALVLEMEGNATVADNVVQSIAAGNIGDNAIRVLTESNILRTTADAGATVNLAPAAVSATGGYAVHSAQVVDVLIDGGPVFTANTQDVRIFIDVGVDGMEGTLRVQGNEVLATARANEVGNRIVLAGPADSLGLLTSANLVESSAAIASRQEMNGDVMATVDRTDDGIGGTSTGVNTLVGEDGLVGNATIADNRVASRAEGNVGSNAIVVRAEAGIETNDASLTSDHMGSRITAPATFAAGGTIGYGIANRQEMTGDLDALTEDGRVLTTIGTGGMVGALKVLENDVSATAQANMAGNLIDLRADGGGIDSSAGVANMQSFIGEADATFGTEGLGTRGGVVINNAGVMTGNATVADNTVGSRAGGNVASNDVFALTDDGAIASGLSVDANNPRSIVRDVGNTANVGNSFPESQRADYGITNAQGVDGSLTAETDRAQVFLVIEGAATGRLGMEDNAITAGAHGNEASNRIVLAGLPDDNGFLTTAGGVDATAGIASTQLTDVAPGGALTATVTDSRVHMNPAMGFGGGNLYLDRNEIGSEVVGNDVANRITVLTSTGLSSPTTDNTGGAQGTATFGSIPAESYGDYNIASHQALRFGGDTLSGATTTHVDIRAWVEGVADGLLYARDNALLAETSGNLAANAIGLSAGSVQTTAAISNSQIVEGSLDSLLTATDPANPAATPFDLQGIALTIDEVASGNLVTVTGNEAASRTVANDGVNSLTVASEGSVTTASDPLDGPGAIVGLVPIGGVTPSVLFGASAGNPTEPPFDVAGDGGNGVDFAIANAQSVEGSLSAETSQVGIGTTIGSANGNPITVSSNDILAEAEGNRIVNLLSVDAGGNVANATTAIANLQVADVGPATAMGTVEDAVIGIFVGGASTAGNIKLEDNTIGSLADGNQAVNQTVVVADGQLTGASGPAVSLALLPGLAPFTSAVEADHSVANTQIVSGSLVASTTDVLIAAQPTGGVDGSVSVRDNRLEAIAFANDGASSILLDGGNLVSASSGVASFQVHDGTSSATIDIDSPLGTQGIYAILDDVQNGNVNILGNEALASAAGNIGSNSISVRSEGTIATSLAAGDDLPITAASIFGAGTGVGAFFDGDGIDHGISTVQLGLGGDATVDGLDVYRADTSDVAIGVEANANVTGSVKVGTLAADDGNAIGSRAQANEVVNRLSLTGPADNGVFAPAGTITATGGIANVQGLGFDEVGGPLRTNVIANTSAASIGADLTLTTLEGNLTVSGNEVAARAGGNRSTNLLTANAEGNIAPVADGAATGVATAILTGSAADYSVANAQAALVNDFSASVSGSEIGADVVGAIQGSANIEGNDLLAQARVNRATNQLALDGHNIDASGIVTNAQGAVAWGSGPGVSATVNPSDIRLNLETAGMSEGNVTFRSNRAQALATGNEATNVVMVEASGTIGTALADTEQAVSGAGGPNLFPAQGAVVGNTITPFSPGGEGPIDYGVASLQVGHGAFTATVEDTDMTVDIAATGGVSLDAVSLRFGGLDNGQGNSIGSVAQVNDVANRVQLTGPLPGDIDGNAAIAATAAIANAQIFGGETSTAQVSASTENSNMEMTLTGNVVSGNLKVEGNTISSAAGANRANNFLAAVSGTAIERESPDERALATVGTDGAAGRADYAIVSYQGTFDLSGDGVTARTVDSEIDLSVGGTLTGGSMNFQGNAITASADLNRATNTLLLDGSRIGASAAVINTQDAMNLDGSAPLNTRSTIDNVSMTGTITGAVNGGNMRMDDNAVVSRASGNTASNVLDVTAATPWASPSGGLPATLVQSGGGSTHEVQADYVVLNRQFHGGGQGGHSITATANGVSIALNNNGGISNGSLRMNDNRIVAQASGNTATNLIPINGQGAGTAGTDTGISAAVANRQELNGTSVTAAVTGASIRLASATATGGNATMRGNRIGARAVGNVSTNGIGNLTGLARTPN